MIWRTVARTASWSARSASYAWNATPSGPSSRISLSSASNSADLRATMMTSAMSSASAKLRTTASPMPLEAPVTSTDLLIVGHRTEQEAGDADVERRGHLDVPVVALEEV